MSGLKLENEIVSDDNPPSKRRDAEAVVDATLGEAERAVDQRIVVIHVAGKVKALVDAGAGKQTQAPDRGTLK